MNKKSIRETAIEGLLRKRAVDLGGMCIKLLPDYLRGLPDRAVLLPDGKLIFVETKRPVGGVLSPSQIVVHETLRRLGFRVDVVLNQDDIDAVFR